MYEFDDIQSFELEDEVLENPFSVYLVDKRVNKVKLVSDCGYLYILKAMQDTEDRFLFYKKTIIMHEEDEAYDSI